MMMAEEKQHLRDLGLRGPEAGERAEEVGGGLPGTAVTD